MQITTQADALDAINNIRQELAVIAGWASDSAELEDGPKGLSLLLTRLVRDLIAVERVLNDATLRSEINRVTDREAGKR